MKTTIELYPFSGRGQKKIIEVDVIQRIPIHARNPKDEHAVIIDRSGLMVAWVDNTAFLPGPSRVAANKTVLFSDETALGRWRHSIDVGANGNAVLVPISADHPFVLNGRKYNRLEVKVQ